MAVLKKQSETEKLEIEQIEEIKRKYVKDSELLQREAFELRAHNDKLDKSKKKLQNDFADISVELEKYKNSCLSLGKQQKNFDKKISEEKVLREQLLAEKDQVEREAREKETRLLNLLRDIEERNELYIELEKKYK